MKKASIESCLDVTCLILVVLELIAVSLQTDNGSPNLNLYSISVFQSEMGPVQGFLGTWVYTLQSFISSRRTEIRFCKQD
jgi:hypothetical protein